MSDRVNIKNEIDYYLENNMIEEVSDILNLGYILDNNQESRYMEILEKSIFSGDMNKYNTLMNKNVKVSNKNKILFLFKELNKCLNLDNDFHTYNHFKEECRFEEIPKEVYNEKIEELLKSFKFDKEATNEEFNNTLIDIISETINNTEYHKDLFQKYRLLTVFNENFLPKIDKNINFNILLNFIEKTNNITELVRRGIVNQSKNKIDKDLPNSFFEYIDYSHRPKKLLSEIKTISSSSYDYMTYQHYYSLININFINKESVVGIDIDTLMDPNTHCPLTQTLEKIKKHLNIVFLNNEQNLLKEVEDLINTANSDINKLSITLEKIESIEEIKLLYPKIKEYLSDIDISYRNCQESRLSILEEQEINNLYNNTLPLVIEKFLSIPKNLRACLTGTQNKTAEELLLESLEIINNSLKIIYYENKINNLKKINKSIVSL